MTGVLPASDPHVSKIMQEWAVAHKQPSSQPTASRSSAHRTALELPQAEGLIGSLTCLGAISLTR